MKITTSGLQRYINVAMKNGDEKPKWSKQCGPSDFKSLLGTPQSSSIIFVLFTVDLCFLCDVVILFNELVGLHARDECLLLCTTFVRGTL